MILEATAQCLSYPKLTRPLSTPPSSSSPLFFPAKTSNLASGNYSRSAFKNILPQHPKCLVKQEKVGVAYASGTEEQVSVDDAARWVLEPVGDGDWKHIGFQVPMPGAYEIVSDVMTVGRVPEKAEIVIPVATVSGVHARFRKEAGALFITDLDSTNGTFIDDQRIRPGAIVRVPSGSCVTFGDIHLAMFRVTKLEKVKEESAEKEEVEGEIETAQVTSG